MRFSWICGILMTFGSLVQAQTPAPRLFPEPAGQAASPVPSADESVRAQKIQLLQQKKLELEKLQQEIDRLTRESGAKETVLLKTQCLLVKDWRTLRAALEPVETSNSSGPAAAPEKTGKKPVAVRGSPPVPTLISREHQATGLPVAPEAQAIRIVGAAEVGKLQRLLAIGDAKLLAQPQLIVLSGQRAAFLAGAQMPDFGSKKEFQKFFEKRQASTPAASQDNLGSKLLLHPRITASRKILLQYEFAVTKIFEIVPVAGGTANEPRPGERFVVRAGEPLEIRPATTLLLSGFPGRNDVEPVVWLVTCELIEPLPTVSGQTMPSGCHVRDEVQYFPHGPEFKLSRQVKVIDEDQLRQKGGSPPGNPPATDRH